MVEVMRRNRTVPPTPFRSVDKSNALPAPDPSTRFYATPVQFTISTAEQIMRACELAERAAERNNPLTSDEAYRWAMFIVGEQDTAPVSPWSSRAAHPSNGDRAVA